jgi:hypothetical protein
MAGPQVAFSPLDVQPGVSRAFGNQLVEARKPFVYKGMGQSPVAGRQQPEEQDGTDECGARESVQDERPSLAGSDR